MNETVWKALGYSAAAGFVYIWGTWTDLMGTLLVLILLDFVTGILAAIQTGKLNSKQGSFGIVKKTISIFVIAMCHHLDLTLGTGNTIRDGALMFYAVNEIVSIVENVGRAGVPLPQQLTDVIEVLKGRKQVAKNEEKQEEKQK